MTQREWQQLEYTVAQMTVEEKHRLLALVSTSLTKLEPRRPDPLLGLMADEPELLDHVVDFVLEARENHPLRLPDTSAS
jgi:hypothetical protein